MLKLHPRTKHVVLVTAPVSLRDLSGFLTHKARSNPLLHSLHSKIPRRDSGFIFVNSRWRRERVLPEKKTGD